MATFAFVMASLTGHLHSTFKMARDLSRRGHRVVYFGDGDARAQAIVTAQGYAYEALPFVQSITAGEVSTSERWAAVRAAPRHVADLLARWSPSLLVFDPFLLVYAIPFHPHRVPVVALSTKPLLDWDPIVPPYVSHVVPWPSPVARLRVQAAWLRCHASRSVERAGSVWRRLRTGYTPYVLAERLAADAGYPIADEWAPRPVPFDVRLRSVPELVLHARELEFPRALPLRAGVHYLGPSVDLERSEPAPPPTSPGRRLVYCSLGTIRKRLGEAAMFLRRVVDAFAGDGEHTLVVATGSRAIREAIHEEHREHVEIHEAVPQLEILRRASLHITHGGASSVKESVHLGVPMLVFPRAADQPGNAARIVFHGLGRRGIASRADAAWIRRAALAVMADRAVRENLTRMREHFLRYDEGDTVALLERFTEPRRSRGTAR